jgi:Leucine-rich repeat (LRR) protein
VRAVTRLTNLNVSANSALTHLFCLFNSLTRLDVSASTNLTWLNCTGNPITEIIVADTNNLPVTFSYDGNPTIREP